MIFGFFLMLLSPQKYQIDHVMVTTAKQLFSAAALV